MLISVLTVAMKDGLTVTFIPHQELLDAGYEHLEDFLVVEANAKYYELQGFDNKTQLWWVEEIPLEPEVSDTGQSVESMGEGGSEGPGGNPIGSSGE